MAPTSHDPPSSDCNETSSRNLERKPPMAPPRKSPRNSYSEEMRGQGEDGDGTEDAEDAMGFLGKLSKFEMLARQSRNSVSPKVFPLGASTTNVPAERILVGRSRSSSLVSLLGKSSGNLNQQGSNTETSNRRVNAPRIDSGQVAPKQIPANNLMSRSFTGSTLPTGRPSEFAEYTREFDMSQSLVLAKTTTTEFLRLDKFSNDSPSSYHRVDQNYGSVPSVKRIQPPSPAFDRNPRRYDETAAARSPSNCEASPCRYRYDPEPERKRKLAQEERLREQEVERRERSRLEEILAMCAEYERQSASGSANTTDRPRQPNRIKTNGSLPRDKRPGYNSPFGSSPESPIASQRRCFSSSSTTETSENRAKQRYVGDGTNNNCSHELTLSNDDDNNNNNNDENNGFSASVSRAQRTYENVSLLPAEKERAKVDPRRTGETIFGTIRLNGRAIEPNGGGGCWTRDYENLAPTSSELSLYENNNRGGCSSNGGSGTSSLRRNGHLANSCRVIENKLAISNDDLLEAIQQLSMLATRSKETIVATPKRNNTERNNARSNEAKADRERERLQERDRNKYVEFLHNEKLHILGNMDVLKRSIADIEVQEEEINRELELEKALLSAEYDSESLELTADEGERMRTQMRIDELELEMAEDTRSQETLQAEAKRRVQRAQRACIRLEEELANCEASDDADDDEAAAKRRAISDKLALHQDILESERKSFEDLEFHHLEEEASKLATREELQRNLSELSAKIEKRKGQLDHLEAQRSTMKNSATRDTKSLERQKLAHARRLEEARGRLRAIEEELDNLMRDPPENCEEKRSPSREDFDRISRVTTDSPITANHQGSLGRKTIESLKEIERNRQLHLAKQGSQVISEERRRVEELKRRVQDEVRSQWEERKMNCTSFNSVESGEESSNYSTGLTESGSGSSDGAEVTGTSEKISSGRQLDEFASSSSPGPSNDSYVLLHGDDRVRRDAGARQSTETAQRLSDAAKSVVTSEENESRPLSQTWSEMTDSVGPLVQSAVKHRDKPKLGRPLTRYLPIKSESLDLRNHIETAGHHLLPLIHDLTIDATTCSGYLSKMSKKFHHWNKRWFVFDRKRKSLSYYSDSSNKKARGLIYFQSIEEVYVDHMNTVKSPQPTLTFVIKTTTRLYHLMAPSPEAMRVWVDVVFTGAEGYREFVDNGA
ncbi:pleckstrin homology-like domain family B member 2 [Venturia canescens]|uniref:pleckstrin homology-like domain family B member 2 n=1 Tax=Venturia canescens TaxID=32260 RepID=UPI001C9D6504|nr:pleckstrin homology-like domain family B member 2 [Venturia canescens]